MRNLKELVKTKERVYVTLGSKKAKEDFLVDARQQGFAFPDGSLPDIDDMDDIYAIHADMTIRHLGWAGHVVYHHAKQGEMAAGEEFLEVSYGE